MKLYVFAILLLVVVTDCTKRKHKTAYIGIGKRQWREDKRATGWTTQDRSSAFPRYVRSRFNRLEERAPEEPLIAQPTEDDKPSLKDLMHTLINELNLQLNEDSFMLENYGSY
ncbi:hypothetical protein BSL78_14002 [Apostichopus japonicus]|uniref:Uncharacterized protein n=1 Tax=Stichopus japonicus TaxID=307972 RepID=A0A2G8KM96_STIJA|nr:hypothetical protein BSL78_14002 [Apostichopus japonicus]